MSSFAPTLRSLTAKGGFTIKHAIARDVLERRLAQRRRTLMLQLASYIATSAILTIYGYAGAIAPLLPILYGLCGATITGAFLILSQMQFNDRFEDHYLTVSQMALNLAVQIGFLIAAPQIGYTFLGVMYVIFSFGALRMTPRQATIAWTLMTLGLAPLFLTSGLSITMPATSALERLAAMLCFVFTIGQCAFIGLYGSALRNKVYQSSEALKVAYRRIEELAEIDELTGAFNRRSIMRALDNEIGRAARLKHPCSVALIDLDWFKQINDVFGHPSGDEVLRTFAITIFANIRGVDAFGRYGGEEFLLVLPDTSHDDAMRLLNRLRAIVSGLDWSAFSPDLSLTMSAGVATLLANESAEPLLARADNALYVAKRGGRNRVSGAA